MAVGSRGTNFNPLTLAERWDGTAWAVVPTPNPAPHREQRPVRGGVHFAVACTAVGFFANTNVLAPLVERWNGTAWLVVPSPNPMRKKAKELLGVSCAATSAGTAGECFFDGNFGCLATLAEKWDGTAWTIQPTPPVGQALTGVGCAAASSCIAVGHRFDNGIEDTLTERWDGTAWKVVPSPNPHRDHLVELYGVSCPTSACVAVGSFAGGLGGAGTLAERWDGTTWTILQTANPRGGGQVALYGVACSAATVCTAVGNYQTDNIYDQAGYAKTLAERWDANDWTIQATPTPTAAS